MSDGCEVRLRIFDPPEWTSSSFDLDTLLSLFYIVTRRSAYARCDSSNRKYLNWRTSHCVGTIALGCPTGNAEIFRAVLSRTGEGGCTHVIGYESDRRKIS